MPPAFRRPLVAVAALALAAIALAGCATPPAASPSSTPTVTESAATPTPTPTPLETEKPQGLPTDCTAMYSDAMLGTLNAENPPLNDPGVTLYSTELSTGLEILDTAPTIRCSWGQPSEFGLATNVTTVDPAQTTALEGAMGEAGMTCGEQSQGVLCRAQGEHIDGDDVVATYGETHFLRDGLWISTHWINYAPEGYTEDIIATLWG